MRPALVRVLERSIQTARAFSATRVASTANKMNEKQGNFHRLAREALPYAPEMVVEKWRSTVSGLTVLWADFDSPLLNAYITVASEIFSDSGAPHTLEHLVFLGSQQYPYKGVLDSLANRAFAQGTNAWTANDHTAYTLTTAGADGFLRMLPVYCDHVFFPTLTEAGFVTEVYHINGKYEDAGVVYSEMQGRENSSADLMELKTQRMLYPRSSAYRSETGGLMSALRVLTIDDIRTYHNKYYAPHNAAIVLCGPLDRDALFDTLMQIDKRFAEAGVAHGAMGPPGWRRPFLETPSAVPPKIDGHLLHVDGVDEADPPADEKGLRRRAFIEFPERDESIGEVQISWVGPPLEDTLELQAIDVLATYLTDSPVSPVQQAFVERDDPLCTDVYFGNSERAGASVISASFSSVPSAQLDTLDIHLHELFERVTTSGIDMARMRTVLRRERERLLAQLETRTADCFSDVLIHEFLYGASDGHDLATTLDDMRRFDALDAYTNDDWVRVLQTHFVENARLVVVGRPSAALVQQLKHEVQERVAARRAELGEAGARELEEKLMAARRANDAPIPPHMLKDFAVPASDTIAWIPVATATSGPTASNDPPLDATPADTALQEHIDSDGAAPPFSIQFDHVKSKFVIISMVFATSSVPQSLRTYLTLYLSMLFSLPIIRRDGTHLPYEAVVQALDEDVLEYDAAIGIGSNFAETVAIELKVAAPQYEKAVAWLHDLLWGSQFALDRLRVAMAKLLQSLPEQKRDGRAVSWALSRAMMYSPHDSTCRANTVLTQATAIPEISALLTEQPDRVIAELETVRQTLLCPEYVRVSVAGDIHALPSPRAPWRDFAPASWHKDCVPERLPWARDVLTTLGVQPHRHGTLCTVSAIESSYAVFTARGISSYMDPDYAALVVTITVLNAMESFLWRYIRGAGLAYGASIRNDPEAQHIHFILYRAPDAAKAFVEGARVIHALATGTELDGAVLQIDETMLESAKSSLHFNVADSEGTVGAAALESFIDARIKCTGRGRGHRLLVQANAVTLADVQRCLRTYILPIFEPATSVCAVASSPTTANAICVALEKAGYKMEETEMPVGASDDEDNDSGSTTVESDSDS